MILLNRLLLRRLRRSLMRTKLRVFTVFLLITIAVYSGVMFSEHTRNADVVYDDFYSETNLADLVVEFDQIESKENVTQHCSSIENQNCESRLVLDGQTYFTYANGTNVWLKSLWNGIDGGDVTSLYPIEGSINPGPGEVVIDAHFWKNDSVNLELGDQILIGAGSGMHSFTIVGVANSPVHLWYAPQGELFPQDGSYVVGYFDVETLAEMANYPSDSRNELHIDIEGTPAFDFSDTPQDEGEELIPLKQALTDSLVEMNTSGNVIDRGGLNGVELLRLDLEGMKKTTPFILGVLLFVTGLVIAVSLDRLIRSQSREIAVMRTIGASGKDIMIGYLLIPLFLGVPGVLFGVLLGISPYGSEFFTNFYFQFMGVPVVVVHHHPGLLLQLSLGALALIFLFGIRPAIRAARMHPLDVIGQSSTKGPNKIVAKITSVLSPGIGLAIRSTFRKPARLAVTLVALSMSMVLLGGMMMMMNGFNSVFNEALDEQENWEYQVYILPSRSDDVELWASENCSTYEMTLTSEATLSGTTKSFTMTGLDVLSSGDDAMHSLHLLDGDVPEEGQLPIQVVIDEGMSELQGYNVGDIVLIEHLGEEIEVEVTGIARELSRTMILHRMDLAELTGFEATGAYFVLKEGSDIDDVRPMSIMVVEKQAVIDGMQQLLDTQQAIMQSTYAIGGLIAIAILLNTLLINLSERDGELATLRVLGASRPRLAMILTVEHAFIGLIGGIAGAFTSFLMYQGLATNFSTWIFHMPVVVDPMVTLQVIGFVLFAALLTTPIGIWRIGRMNLLEVVARHER